MSFHLPCRVWLVVSLLTAGLVVVPAQSGLAATITSRGPLTSVTVTPTLNCAVRHVFDRRPEWYGNTGCGTFIVLNGHLFGPAVVPGGARATPRTPFTPVSQSRVTGRGTTSSPYTITTLVRAGRLAILRQIDRYVVGEEHYTTDVTVFNTSVRTLTGNLYTAGDCHQQNSDFGYGRIIGSAPACAVSTQPGSRLEALVPNTSGSSYYEARYSDLWSAIGSQQALPNTCRCEDYIDNSIGLSWPVRLSLGARGAWSWTTDFTPEGRIPLAVTASAHSPTSLPGHYNGYRVTITNGNAASSTVQQLAVTLPPGFTYVPGSTHGVTRGDPVISGQTLTWTGPFLVPKGGQIMLDFDDRVSQTPGTYTIDATATSDDPVTPALSAAPVTVLATADLELEKTPSLTEVAQGGALTYTLTARNNGPSPEPNAYITDTLPAGFVFDAGTSNPGCAPIGDTVRCDLGVLAAGETRSVVVGVTVAATAPRGFAYDYAEIHGDVEDPNPLLNHAFGSVLVSSDAVSIGKTARPALAGDDLTWTIDVVNGGALTASDAVVTDPLPEGLTFIRATTDNGTCDFAAPSRTVTCTLDPIAGGGRATITLITRTPPDLVPGDQTRTTIADTASVTSAGVTDTTTFEAVVFAAAHLAPAKSAVPSTFVAGRLATYRLSVRNEGPSVATNVTATDSLPRGTTFSTAASDPRCSLVDVLRGTVRCVEPGRVAVGAEVTFDVFVRVDATLGDGSIVVNDLSATGSQFDPNPAPDATVTATVVRRVDLAVTKRAPRGRVRAGQATSFEITVVNRGPSSASDIVIADRVSHRTPLAELSLSAKGSPDCVVNLDSFRCVIPELLPRQRAPLTVSVLTSATAPAGILCDVVTVTSAERDIQAGNGRAAACVKVLARHNRHKRRPRRPVPVTG